MTKTKKKKKNFVDDKNVWFKFIFTNFFFIVKKFKKKSILSLNFLDNF